MRIEHEADESALEARPGAHVDGEASTRELGGALKVENAEGFADLPMSFWRKVELLPLAPGFDGFVVGFGQAGGNFVAREVGNSGEGLPQLLVELDGGLVERVEFFLELAGFVLDCGGFVFFAGLHERADLLAELVAAGLALLGKRDGFAAATIESAKIAEESGGIGATRTEFFFNQFEVGTDES